MKIYLDMCCLKRPFDDQTDPRIRLEAMATETVLQSCRDGEHDLITSDALRFENGRNPNPTRQQYAADMLGLAKLDVPHSVGIETRAAAWQSVGMPLLDSLHLASAEAIGADIFATCDDVLLNRASRLPSNVRIVGLLVLLTEMMP